MSFCGGDAKLISCNRVSCRNCGIRTVGKGSQRRSISDWNTRAQQGDYREGLQEGIAIGRKEVDSELISFIKRYNSLTPTMVENYQRHDYRKMLDIWNMLIPKQGDE